MSVMLTRFFLKKVFLAEKVVDQGVIVAKITLVVRPARKSGLKGDFLDKVFDQGVTVKR